MKRLSWPDQVSCFCFVLLGSICFALLSVLLSAAALEASDNRGEMVLHWNHATLAAIRSKEIAPLEAARDLALIHLAIFEAVNAVENRYQSYLPGLMPVPEASAQWAAMAAAERIASTIFPDYAANFRVLMSKLSQDLPEDSGKEAGLILGATVADQLLAARAKDQVVHMLFFNFGPGLGIWKPSLADTSGVIKVEWGSIKPFALKKVSQFRPGPPPDLQTRQYARDWDEVRRLGAYNSKVRSSEQTTIARFWEDGARTAGPPGHWNGIAEQVVVQSNMDLINSARLFAILNMALTDAGQAAADSKYRYLSWRPELAIQEAKKDTRLGIISNPHWQPLLNTPEDPDYVSLHSTFAAAAAEVLSGLMGDKANLMVTSEGLPEMMRTYHSFSAAAKEAGESRVFGGVHFRASEQAGNKLGRAVGRYVVETSLRPKA